MRNTRVWGARHAKGARDTADMDSNNVDLLCQTREGRGGDSNVGRVLVLSDPPARFCSLRSSMVSRSAASAALCFNPEEQGH